MPEPNHRHRKRFGQHFLHDNNILLRIAQVIQAKEQDHIVEIGPGQGALTAHIIDHVKQLDAIEIDRDLVQYLQQTFTQSHCHIHQGDALKFDIRALKPSEHRLRIIGNLPYNISTPILFSLFQQIDCIADMIFLLQREVVLRMTAPINQKTYGRLSVMTQYFCQAKERLRVPRGAFTPPPKVESSIVQLIPKPPTSTKAVNFDKFSLIVREAFNHRRKTIHNALKKLINTQQLSSIDINSQARPQELSLEEYIRISNKIELL